MKSFQTVSVVFKRWLPLAACSLCVACSSGSEASKGAKEGAGIGALAGAVGGMATALVFGGNVAEAGARGAVAGGSSGAVVGGISGAQRDKQKAAQAGQAGQETNDVDEGLERIRRTLGEDTYNGMVALANCKYGVAAANADAARRSANPDHALGGLWLGILADADQRNEAGARAMFPQLIERDAKIATEAEAEAAMRDALQKLGEIRAANGLPTVCPS